MNEENTQSENNQTSQPQAADLQNQVKDLEDKWKRCAAELENYRKQVEKDRVDFAQFANSQALIALLPVLDNFKRANTHLPEDLQKNEWVKGVASIEAQLEATLKDLGLQELEVKVGDEVNPNLHEVVATGEGESGKILDVLEAGYELHGKILRAAKVRVGK